MTDATVVKSLERCELSKIDESVFLLTLTKADNRFHPILMEELVQVFDFIEAWVFQSLLVSVSHSHLLVVCPDPKGQQH
jgi:hypothetical protein